jgi:lipopolysaccharide export system protein LptA
MSRGLPLLLLGAAALFGACTRRGARAPDVPAPATPAAADTAAERARRDREQAAADSARRAADTLAGRTPETTAAPPAPAPASPDAPGQRCILDLENLPETRALVTTDPVSRRRVTIISGGIRGRCRNQEITIRGDSAEAYEQNGLYILIGNVHYREPRVAIDAQRATYYRLDERLLLEENVHAELQRSPATIDGRRVEYFRAVEGVREQERVVAYSRPRLTYIEKDSTGMPLPPVVMDANRIVGDGDSTFHAMGQVDMVREDLTASGDSALFDGKRNFARLMKEPVIESRGKRPYTLRGRVIDLYGAAREVERVVAIDSASAVSEDLTLRADTIDLRVAERELERAFAFGTTGARATTPQRDLLADSLDIVMPAQRLREIRAVGKAYAESDPDSTKVRTNERDWMRGDTVLAFFDTLPPADTTSQPDLRELAASGQASALYQVPSERGALARPGINYVRGRVIRLFFAEGEVDRVTVVDSASGVYLEPVNDTAAVRPAPAPASRPPVPPPPPVIRPPGPPFISRP